MLSLTVQLNLPPTMQVTDSEGTVYTAKQMHLHWGGDFFELSGSEHTVDGIRRVIEVRDSPNRVPFPSSSSCFFLVCVCILCHTGVMYVHMHESVHAHVCVCMCGRQELT